MCIVHIYTHPSLSILTQLLRYIFARLKDKKSEERNHPFFWVILCLPFSPHLFFYAIHNILLHILFFIGIFCHAYILIGYIFMHTRNGSHVVECESHVHSWYNLLGRNEWFFLARGGAILFLLFYNQASVRFFLRRRKININVWLQQSHATITPKKNST